MKKRQIEKSLMSRHHVLISGTGRCGTSFLVELLTNLGLDTGFDSESLNCMNNVPYAGLERDVRQAPCPYIVKTPFICDYADEILKNSLITIDHLFIPVRDLFAAAESRRSVSRQNVIAGGLWKTASMVVGDQENVLLQTLYSLILAFSSSQIPVTLIQYPLLANDPDYLYQKLKPILNQISLDEFRIVFKKTVKQDYIHSYTKESEI